MIARSARDANLRSEENGVTNHLHFYYIHSFPSGKKTKGQLAVKRLNSSNSILSAAFGPLIISPMMSEPGGTSNSKIGSPALLMFANTTCLKCQRKRIDWSTRVPSKLLIEMFVGDALYISCEADNGRSSLSLSRTISTVPWSSD